MRKEQIAKTALTLFQKHGVKVVTVDDIVRELGISKKTFYQYFPSKNSLIEFNAYRMYDRYHQSLQRLLGKSKTPIHEYFDLNEMLVNMAHTQFSPSMIYQINKYYPKLSAEIELRRFKDFREASIKNLREGIEKGYYNKDINEEFIYRIHYVLSKSIYQDEIFEDIKTSDSFSDSIYVQLIEYHIRGIATEKGRRVLDEILSQSK